MLIGVVSDTHGHTGRMLDALRLLAEFPITALLHCGDIGSVDIVRLVTQWPAHFVLGNVDEPLEEELREACLAAGHFWHGPFAELELARRRIAVTHSHRRGSLPSAIASGSYDLVCYGHTHHAEQRRADKTLVLNPGALYRASTPTCAVVDLIQMTADILKI